MKIEEVDAGLLRRSIELGEAILVLGAGASYSSLNAAGEPIKMGEALADLLASRVGMARTEETLTEVLGAVYPRLISREQLGQILQKEYLRCTPSPELADILSYVWKRIYTWNIDDTIENIKGQRVQIRHHFNGMSEKVSLYNDIAHVEVVHLHGQVSKPDNWYILTEEEYNQRLARDSHDWYKQLGRDYVSSVPIFIGSKLKEPILSLELYRARGENGGALGRAYLITPDAPSEIQRGDFESRQIIHIQGTLADFVEWLSATFSGSLTATQSASASNEFVSEVTSRLDLADRDLDTLRRVFPIRWSQIHSAFSQKDESTIAKEASHFLSGSPPTWQLVTSDVPVMLSATDDLYTALMTTVSNRDRLFVVHGQSGSGKTTAIMQCLVNLSKDAEAPPIYEIKGDVKSLRHALRLIERIHRSEHVVIYLKDAFIYGDALGEDASYFTSGKFTIVTSARSGEWKEHLARRLGGIATTYKYERFGREDYDHLIDRLTEYVPAPKFARLTRSEKIDSLAKSRSQLLIALREATESKKFSKIITDEFRGLKNADSQALLAIVGIATLARVGLSRDIAQEAYAEIATGRSFDEALVPLEGIVIQTQGGRLVARHELYVRPLIENVIDLDVILDVIIAILKTFTRYAMPITKTVGRQDSQLFRYLLGHNFLHDLCDRRNRRMDGLRVYQEFEVDFQLDGHYWLQFGQYLVQTGNPEDALPILHRSIQAYEANNYAWHALADVQLRVAKRREKYDSVTVELIADAVRILKEQDASPDLRTDSYAIVTLTFGHISALIKHGKIIEAHTYAADYFERVQELSRTSSDSALRRAKERLAHYLVHDEWLDGGGPRRNGR